MSLLSGGISANYSANSYKLRTIEKLASDTAECYGFREIRLPTLENNGQLKPFKLYRFNPCLSGVYAFEAAAYGGVQVQAELIALAYAVLERLGLSGVKLCLSNEPDRLAKLLDAMQIKYDRADDGTLAFYVTGECVCRIEQGDGGYGFEMEIATLLKLMEKQGCDFEEPKKCSAYIAAEDELAEEKAFELVKRLRDEGYRAECGLTSDGLEYAGKINAEFIIMLGKNELESGRATLKNTVSGENTDISVGDGFVDDFSDNAIANMFSNVPDMLI